MWDELHPPIEPANNKALQPKAKAKGKAQAKLSAANLKKQESAEMNLEQKIKKIQETQDNQFTHVCLFLN
jgi:hypothetical protein